MHTLPDLILHLHALLWSINERLGGQPGKEIAPLSQDWLHDLIDFDALATDEWDALADSWRTTAHGDTDL